MAINNQVYINRGQGDDLGHLKKRLALAAAKRSPACCIASLTSQATFRVALQNGWLPVAAARPAFCEDAREGRGENKGTCVIKLPRLYEGMAVDRLVKRK